MRMDSGFARRCFWKCSTVLIYCAWQRKWQVVAANTGRRPACFLFTWERWPCKQGALFSVKTVTITFISIHIPNQSLTRTSSATGPACSLHHFQSISWICVNTPWSLMKNTTLCKQGPRSFSFMFPPHTLESGVPQGFYAFNCFYFVDAEILFSIMAYIVLLCWWHLNLCMKHNP